VRTCHFCAANYADCGHLSRIRNFSEVLRIDLSPRRDALADRGVTARFEHPGFDRGAPQEVSMDAPTIARFERANPGNAIGRVDHGGDISYRSNGVSKRPLNRHLTRNLIAQIRACFLGAFSVAGEWARRWHSRRELRSLGRREIADFCPKLTEAMKEAEKPFWRP
jgi:uncharacterized protein YjiS (DUF1127 family)